MKKISAAIIPDIGNDIQTSHWYGWLNNELEKMGLTVLTKDIPISTIGHKNSWLHHLENVCNVGKDSIIIGHSIGAAAAFRYAEQKPIFGIIAVSATHTDQGYVDRTKSDYYSQPWDWNLINKNCNWVVQFSSSDDDNTPVREARYIHEQLNSEYHEYTDRGHFGSEYRDEKKFPEIIEVVKRKLFL